MTDKRISELTEVTALAGSDEFAVNDAGVSKRVQYTNVLKPGSGVTVDFTAASFRRNLAGIADKTGTYTISVTEVGQLHTQSGTYTVNLPAVASAGSGFFIRLRNIGTGTITIDGALAETIDGVATITLPSQAEVMLVCDGAVWRTINMAGNVVIEAWRFGVSLDGTTDDSTALQAAMTAADGHTLVLGRPGQTCLIETEVTLPDTAIIDGGGATLKPSGATQCLLKAAPSADASTTVASGASIGSNSVVVASAVGLSVGQWFRITADNTPTEDDLSYPAQWGKITNIAGTTITLDAPLVVTYAGTITLNAYDALHGKLTLKNIKFDGSANTFNASSGQAIDVGGYETVVLEDIEVLDYNNDASATNAIQIVNCPRAIMRNIRTFGCISPTDMIDVQFVSYVDIDQLHMDGDHFMIDVLQAVSLQISNVFMRGRAASGDNSVRGIKPYGCSAVSVDVFYIENVETPFKPETCDRISITNGVIKNCGNPNDNSGGGIGVSSQVAFTRQGQSLLSGVVIEKSYGYGIAIDADTTGGWVITDFIIKNIYADGIFLSDDVSNFIVSNGLIIDFAQEGTTSFSGIDSNHATGTGTIDNVHFSNSDTTPYCMSIVSSNVAVKRVVSLTANPLTSIAAAEALHDEIGASVRLASEITDETGDGTSYTVLFDTEYFDHGGCYNAGTPDGKFTAILTGKYQICGALEMNDIGASHSAFQVQVVHKNSSDTVQGVLLSGHGDPSAMDTGGVLSVPFTGIFDMAAGDYLTVTVNVAGSTKTVDLSADATATNTQPTWAAFTRVST